MARPSDDELIAKYNQQMQELKQRKARIQKRKAEKEKELINQRNANFYEAFRNILLDMAENLGIEESEFLTYSVDDFRNFLKKINEM